MKNFNDSKLEENSLYGEFHLVIIFNKRGYRLGYLGVPKTKQFLISDNYEGISSVAHGNITYEGTPKNETFNQDYFYVGIDCNHFGDRKDINSLIEYGIANEKEADELMVASVFEDDEGSTVKTKEYVFDNLIDMIIAIRDPDNDVHNYCLEKKYISEYYEWLRGNHPLEKLPEDLALFIKLKTKGE
jgi:hypothetical protein